MVHVHSGIGSRLWPAVVGSCFNQRKTMHYFKAKIRPIPLWTHKGQEGLTYPTVHTFQAEHPTVAILQVRRDAYPTVHTQGRGRADLSHCAHFSG